MYNEKQQKVVDAWNAMQRERYQQEMAQFGEPQDHDNREFLTPIREIINLYATDENFTPADVVEGIGAWAQVLAHQEMKRIEEKTYDRPINGRYLICASHSRLKFCWMDWE